MTHRHAHAMFQSRIFLMTAAIPLFFAALPLAQAVGTSPQYTVVDLGAIGYLTQAYDFSQAQLFKSNDSGAVAGTSSVDGKSRAVVRLPGASSFSLLPDEGESAASAINASGAIAGWSHAIHERKATVWKQNNAGVWVATILPIPPNYTLSTAWDINDNGLIVGSVEAVAEGAVTGTKYPAFWPSATQDPVIVGGGNAFVGEAFAVNNLGRVVGVKGANTFSSVSQTFYWDVDSANVVIVPNISGPLGTGASSWGAADINENHVMVGGAQGKVTSGFANWEQILPFAWTPSLGTKLIAETLNTTSWALGVNNVGYVVGVQQWGPNSGRTPLVYRQELDANGASVWREYPLLSLVPAADKANWLFSTATGISNVGHIVGEGTFTVAGVTDRHAYMLIPAISDLSVSQTVVTPAAAKPSGSFRSKLTERAVGTGTGGVQSTRVNVRVLNQGPLPATNIVLETQVPEALNVSTTNSADGSCVTGAVVNGKVKVRCAFASLAVGASGNAVIDVSTNVTGSYEVVSTVSATELDSLNSDNNSVKQTVTVTKAQGQSPVVTTNNNTNNNEGQPPPSNSSTGTAAPAANNSGGGCTVGNGKDSDFLLVLLALGSAISLALRRRRRSAAATHFS